MSLETAAWKIGESPKHLAEALKLDPPQRPNLTPPWLKEGGDAA